MRPCGEAVLAGALIIFIEDGSRQQSESEDAQILSVLRAELGIDYASAP